MADTPLLRPNDLDYAWRWDFFDKYRLSGNQINLYTIQDFKPVQYFLDRNISAIQVSNGSGENELGSVLNVDRRWVLTGRNWLHNIMNDKPSKNWSDADIENVTSWWRNNRNVKHITADTDEEGYNSVAVKADEAPDVWRKFHTRMAINAAGKGEIYYNQYSGVIYTAFNTIGDYYSFLESPASALAYFKGQGAYSICPWFREEMYKLPGSGFILNAYARGPVDWGKRSFELMGQLGAGWLCQQAMASMGYNCPGMVYTEGVDNEIGIGSGTVGHTGYYPRLLDNGNKGHCVGLSWPTLSLNYIEWEGFMIKAFQNIDCVFKPMAQWGSNPLIVKNDSSENPQFYYYHDNKGYTPQRGGVGYILDPPSKVVAYPPHPLGNELGHMTADMQYDECVAWVGSKQWSFPSISVSGAQSATPQNARDMRFIATMAEKELPRAIFGQAGDRRWLDVYSPYTCTATFGMNGINKTLNLIAGDHICMKY